VLKDSAAIPNKAVAAAVLTLVLIIITPVLTSSIREYTCDYGRASVQQPSPGAIVNFCLILLLARLISDLIARTLCPELSRLLLRDVQP